jgi:hypothetical protein
MKNLLTLFFLLIITDLFAQNSVSFFVVDSLTKQVVPFLKIVVAGKDKGTYSDEKGFVKMTDLSGNDTLFIDNIFYEKKLLPIKTLRNNQQIVLSPVAFILNEAVVKPLIEKEIGYAKIHSNTSYFNALSGSELAFLIEPENIHPAYIRGLIIKIKKNPKNDPLVRIHLYHNEQGIPGAEIYLKDNLIIISDKNLMKFNIKNQDIQLPLNGIFVSIEWIGKFNEKGKISNDYSYVLNPLINVKSTSDKKMKGKGFTRRYGNWKPHLTKSPKGNEEYYIPLFGLIVEEYN